MHHDLSSEGAASADSPSLRFGRVISGAFIVLAVGAIAYYAESGGARSDRAESGIANLASNPPAPTAATASPLVAPAGAPRFRRTDEPAYTDATNPHGG